VSTPPLRWPRHPRRLRRPGGFPRPDTASAILASRQPAPGHTDTRARRRTNTTLASDVALTTPAPRRYPASTPHRHPHRPGAGTP